MKGRAFIFGLVGLPFVAAAEPLKLTNLNSDMDRRSLAQAQRLSSRGVFRMTKKPGDEAGKITSIKTVTQANGSNCRYARASGQLRRADILKVIPRE